MNRFRSCKFRTGIECIEFGDKCDDCGWNPLVEAKREHELETGAVKTYLKIDLSRIATEMDTFHHRSRMQWEGENIADD